jgi:hypothetical protein
MSQRDAVTVIRTLLACDEFADEKLPPMTDEAIAHAIVLLIRLEVGK